jgi:hypothetical protein
VLVIEKRDCRGRGSRGDAGMLDVWEPDEFKFGVWEGHMSDEYLKD